MSKLKSLFEFDKNVISNSKLTLILGGEKDTNTAVSFWGYGTSVADCDPGNGGDWTYWFADGRSLQGDPPPTTPH